MPATTPHSILEVEALEVRYGPVVAASGISLRVDRGEVVCLLGPNGAGKTSVLRSIMGLVQPAAGKVRFFDGTTMHEIAGLSADALARLGIANVPAQHVVLPRMTVEENLEMGALFLVAGRDDVMARIDALCQRFPILGERRRQQAGTLSGGEQRVLAIARALMARPRLMLLDEPSLGLAPLALRAVFDLLREISRNDGIDILLVEQNVKKALEISDRAYVMRVGGMEFSGPSHDILASDRLHKAYLGS